MIFMNSIPAVWRRRQQQQHQQQPQKKRNLLFLQVWFVLAVVVSMILNGFYSSSVTLSTSDNSDYNNDENIDIVALDVRVRVNMLCSQ